ncbi:MAG: cyclic nucleotide-binding domain-containing protein [Anaerolineales bacterium]|nr:cyclic nucleotide-binding domain-containing protein [Anaerolineales bacterium]
MPTDTSYLKDYPCFRNLSESQLGAIAEITNAVCYPPGYVLFKEGKPGERLFFLVKGEVEVFYEIGEAGQVRVDTVWGEDVIGCSALVEPYEYTATERSLTEIEVLEIDALALRELMQKDCCLGFSLLQYLISNLMKRVVDLRLGAEGR